MNKQVRRAFFENLDGGKPQQWRQRSYAGTTLITIALATIAIASIYWLIHSIQTHEDRLETEEAKQQSGRLKT